MQLISIAKGWYNFINGTEEVKSLMQLRLNICDTCPDKVQLTTAGQKLIQAVNKEGSIYKCRLCTCPLAAKTNSPDEGCPAGKW
jgi:hypothetical protein